MALGMLLLTGCDSLKAFMSRDLEHAPWRAARLPVAATPWA